MAYDNGRSNYDNRGGGRPQYNGNRGSGGQQNGGYRNPAPASQYPQPVVAKALPEDYVSQADAVMQKLVVDDRNLTSTKLRHILSMFMDIYNTETRRSEKTLLENSVLKLRTAQVRIVYECGRTKEVKFFAEQSNLLSYIKDIGSDRAKLISLVHYIEALVAYHRFYGGKEK